MTISGFSGPACREVRQLLGVYVVGAIDPSDRPLVDDHLGECADCRDELAGLAGLPAMLSRVPAADIERIASGVTNLPEGAEPSPELLNSLLRRVSARRRSRMWRGAAAVAAAAVVAAGGATAVTQLTKPHQPQVVSREVASAMNPATHVAAVVDYSQTPWNTTDMRVEVSGIAAGTNCRFWVVGSHGRTAAGGWTVGLTYTRSEWYEVSAPVRADEVRGFQITDGSKVLVNIPAAAHPG
jgi:anti-sigma-K factor RskA